MKAKVDVSRTGYANRDIEVEVPDSELEGLTPAQVQDRLHEAAVDAAGGFEFSEHDSRYEAMGSTLVAPCPSCGKDREGALTPTTFERGSACQHCGHVEPDEGPFEELNCAECGKPFSVDAAGVATHDGDGPDGIDHDADASHVPYWDAEPDHSEPQAEGYGDPYPTEDGHEAR